MPYGTESLSTSIIDVAPGGSIVYEIVDLASKSATRDGINSLYHSSVDDADTCEISVTLLLTTISKQTESDHTFVSLESMFQGQDYVYGPDLIQSD